MTNPMDWNGLASTDIPSLSDDFRAFTTNGGPALSGNLAKSSILRSTQQAANTTSTGQTTLLSLEERLERQDHELLGSIIKANMEETKKRIDAAIENQLQRLWEQDCAGFRNQLKMTRKPDALDVSRNRMLPQLTVQSFATAGAEDVDPNFIAAHWKIIQNSKNQRVIDTINQLMSISDSKAYRTGWNLVANLASTSYKDPVSQAKATLAFFAKDFAEMVVQRVINEPGGFVSQCEAFAKFNLGILDDLFWPTLYFLLRGGDCVSALRLVHNERVSMDPAIVQILTDLAKLQGTYSCIFDCPNMLHIARNLQVRVDELLTSGRSREPQNIYELGVYCFLSGSSKPEVSETMEGFKNIEDWLTSLLWGALFSKDPDAALISLGETIQHYGPSHFDDQGLGGWSYCLPLLASQQYEAALVWLTQNGGQMGLLQATHLAMMLSKAGIPVTNLLKKTKLSDGDETTAKLLSEYAKVVVGLVGAEASLDYLVHIPDEFHARKEIASLVANSGDRDNLVGKLDDQGRRQGGALAKHFPNVAPILIEAANKAFNKNDKTKASHAVVILMLAEDYPKVLHMLNNLICPPSKPDEFRSFWMTQLAQFHSAYLNRRSYVLDKLQEADAMKLIDTSKILMQLNRFYENIHLRQPPMQCLHLIQELNLLPTSDSDQRLKEQSYKDLDPLVKAAFPDLLVTMLEIMHQEHGRLKKELYNDKTGVVRERLKEIQTMAKLYLSFATAMQLNGEGYSRLSQLTALMV